MGAKPPLTLAAWNVAESILEARFIEQIRARPAFTEQELVQRAINFANGRTSKSWLDFVAPGAQSQYEGRELDVGLQAQQAAFRAALTAVVESNVTRARAADWCRAASDVVVVADYGMHGNAVSSAFRYEQVSGFTEHRPGEGGLFALVLVWLLDPTRPYRNLCKCHLSSCEAFFLAKPPKKQGRWLRRYCTTRHMEQAHNEARQERADNRRARKGK